MSINRFLVRSACSSYLSASGAKEVSSPPWRTACNLASIASLLTVPTILARRTPPTKKSNVGMDWISYHMLRSGLSSALTLRTLTLPAHAAATSSRVKSRIWQGRLHGARNATRTGCVALRTSDRKSASPISTVRPLSGFVFTLFTRFQTHRPLRNSRASESRNCVTCLCTAANTIRSPNSCGSKYRTSEKSSILN